MLSTTKQISFRSQRDLVAASLLRTGSPRGLRWDERVKTTYADRKS
jgi:hypothetical protein